MKLKSRPLKDELDVASVVVLTKWLKTDTGQKAILAEALKQDPSVSFPFKPGDEIRETERLIREGVDYGEGELLFFAGSPPKLGYSVAYVDGRVRDTDGSRIETIRDLLRK